MLTSALLSQRSFLAFARSEESTLRLWGMEGLTALNFGISRRKKSPFSLFVRFICIYCTGCNAEFDPFLLYVLLCFCWIAWKRRQGWSDGRLLCQSLSN